MFDAIRKRFSLRVRDARRMFAAVTIATKLPGPPCVAAIEPYEPNVPWDERS
jgi:hypothetical protein